AELHGCALLSKGVTRGLDPLVHPLGKKHFAKRMDCRDKPGNDGGWFAARRSRRDGRDRADLVAVLLVEPEVAHDADAFGQGLAVEIAERLAPVARAQRPRLHPRPPPPPS